MIEENIAPDSAGSPVLEITRERLEANLPEEVFDIIIGVAIGDFTLPECLQLRFVSRHCNDEVLRNLFNLFQINAKYSGSDDEPKPIDSLTVVRYWAAFIQTSSPLRSLNGFNQPSNHALGSYQVYVNKQMKRLKSIHATLRQTLELLVNESKTEADQGLEAQHPIDSCLATLGETVVCLIGPLSAWNYIHYKHNSREEPFHYRNFPRVRAESYETYDLVAKSAKFWDILVSAYRGDLDGLARKLAKIKINHTDLDKWLERLSDNYVELRKKSSSAEKRWLETLSACLTIAVSQNNTKVVRFIMEQDVATSSVAVSSICFNEIGLLEVAVQNCALPIVDILLETGWLMQTPSRVTREQYNRGILRAAKLPSSSLDRNAIITKLLTSRSVWQTRTVVQGLLSRAAHANDMWLAETILSIPTTLDTSSERGQAPQRDRIERSHPLNMAVLRSDRAMVRFLLHNSEKLHIDDLYDNYHSSFTGFSSTAIRQCLEASETPDEHILTDLLTHYPHDQVTSAQTLVLYENGTNLLRKFFNFVDVHSKHDSHTLGEHALSMAVYIHKIDSIRYLLEECRVRVHTRLDVPRSMIEDLEDLLQPFMGDPRGDSDPEPMHELLATYGLKVDDEYQAISAIEAESACTH